MHTETLEQAERRLLWVLRVLSGDAPRVSAEQRSRYVQLSPRARATLRSAMGDVVRTASCREGVQRLVQLTRTDAICARPEGAEVVAFPALSELSGADVRREVRELLPSVVEQLVTGLATASAKAELLYATARATALWASLANYIQAYYQSESAAGTRGEDLQQVIEAGERLMNALEGRRAELAKLQRAGELKELRDLVACRSDDLPWWLND